MFNIKIENFEGPLDLLLYFIKRDKIDIYDIPITQITNEYISVIDEAKKLAKSAGKLDKIKYGVADAKSYEGKFDYIAFFDCLHDMGDPVGAAKYAYEHLNNDGSVILIEPTANDKPEENFNIFGQMYYSFSTMGCIPTSKSQEVGLSLGAQAGPAKLTAVLQEAGFQECKIVKKNASNMVLEARK